MMSAHVTVHSYGDVCSTDDILEIHMTNEGTSLGLTTENHVARIVYKHEAGAYVYIYKRERRSQRGVYDETGSCIARYNLPAMGVIATARAVAARLNAFEDEHDGGMTSP